MNMTPSLVKLLTLFIALVVSNAAFASTLYVDLNSPNPTSPYTTWSTAATNIQDAVNQAVDGDIVLVTNGTYALSQQITVASDIVIQSVNGKDVTIIDGGGTTRCFSFGVNDCRIDGFSVVNGYASTSFYAENERFGGGARCSNTNPIIANCSFRQNVAAYGGGVKGGTILNCVFIGNRAAYQGGGAYGSHLRSSTFIDNTASSIGGLYEGYAFDCVFFNNSGGVRSGGTSDYCYFYANPGAVCLNGTANSCTFAGNLGVCMGFFGTVNNCFIVGNQGTAVLNATANNCTIVSNTLGMNGGSANNCILWNNTDGNNYYQTVLKSSCSPDAMHGAEGNITNNPLFVAGGYLSANSPCIDSGNPSLITSQVDRDGNPRISGSQVDMGAYEWTDSPRIAHSLASIIRIEVERTDIPLPINFNIRNSGSSELIYTIAEGADWLDVPESGGSSTDNTNACHIILNTSHLDAGTYWGTIVIAADDASNSPQRIGVVLDVYDPVFDHFEMSTVPSPRAINMPFGVTIEAIDTENRTIKTYAPELSFSITKEAPVFMAGKPSSDTIGAHSEDRVWGLSFTLTEDIIVSHVERYFGHKISIWDDDGQLLTSVNASGSPGQWSEIELPAPLFLEAGQTYRIGTYIDTGKPDTANYSVSSGTPLSFANGVINGGCNSTSGDVFPSNSSSDLYLVDLRYKAVGLMANKPSWSQGSTGKDNQVWGLSFTLTEDIIVTHVEHYFGHKISIWNNSGQRLASVNTTGNSGQWSEIELPTPLFLEAGQTYRIGTYIDPNKPGTLNYSGSSGTPLSFASGLINSGCNSTSGDVFPSELSSKLYLVDFKYNPSPREPITNISSNDSAFTEGVLTHNVLVNEGATNVVIRVDNNSGYILNSNPFNVYPPAYDSDMDGLFDFWELSHYQNLEECIPSNDDDDDGINNYAECMALSNPRDTFLKIQNRGTDSPALQWKSYTNRTYIIQRCPNLNDGCFRNISTELLYPQNSFTDSVYNAESSSFYRLQIQTKE